VYVYIFGDFLTGSSPLLKYFSDPNSENAFMRIEIRLGKFRYDGAVIARGVSGRGSQFSPHDTERQSYASVLSLSLNCAPMMPRDRAIHLFRDFPSIRWYVIVRGVSGQGGGLNWAPLIPRKKLVSPTAMRLFFLPV